MRHVLAAALGVARPAAGRPISAYEPLQWLLRADLASRATRAERRALYLRLVHDLAAEFEHVYAERLMAENGPWDFEQVYRAKASARGCIRRMRWCAVRHALRLPGVGVAALDAYRTAAGLS